MTFFLQHNNSGRVFIDTHRLHITSTSIEQIEADSFIEARFQLNELEFDKVDGYGWFLHGVRHG